MPSTQQRLRAYAYLLINTLCWGAAFIIVAPALDYTTPFQFLFYRFALASLFIFPVLFYYLRDKQNRSYIWKIIAIELIGTVLYLSLLYAGLARTTAIETSILATTTPLFIIFACIFLLREKVTRQEWWGLSISLAGILLIAALPLLNGSVGLTRISLVGNGLVLLANVIMAVYAILIKSQYKKIPPFLAVAVSFWLGALVFGFFSLIKSNFSFSALFSTISTDWQQPAVVFASLYMAVFGSIIGLTAYIKGQKLIEASEASLFYYLQPLVYLPLGVLILGEHINSYQIIGLTAILVGVWLSERRH